MEMPTLKLIYFNIPGKAEAIRLALTYQCIAFEDYKFEDRAEFHALKDSGALMFGQVPALEVTHPGKEAVILNQSNAILRYVAKLSSEKDLYPSDPILAARVDAICDQEADTFMGIRITKYKERFGFGFLEEEAYAGLLGSTVEKINAEVIPGHLATLNKQLEMGGTGWLAGTAGPSIADFVWSGPLKQLKEGWSGDEGKAVSEFPKLLELLDRFLALPEVAAYYSK